jgi:hypothetical protein
MLKHGLSYDCNCTSVILDTEIQPLGLYSGSQFPYSAVSRIVPERRGEKNDTVGLSVR